jgi:hypothetical protein
MVILPANCGHLMCLKRLWADIAIGAVSASSIVIYFDVLEYCLSHFLPGSKPFSVNSFHLERVEETFGTGIIKAISLGTHAAQQSVFPD